MPGSVHDINEVFDLDFAEGVLFALFPEFVEDLGIELLVGVLG